MKNLITILFLSISTIYNAGATVFTVNGTADTNTGSGTTGTLRWCITQANLTAAKDTIDFAITGAGPHTLTVATNYPVISFPLYINGFSQTGSVQGQLGTGTRLMKIILNGPGTNSVYGLQITTTNCVIAGLVLQDFFKAIWINGGDNNWIWGCYVGTSDNGLSISAAVTCYDDGIALNNNADNNIIGTNGDGSNDANEGNLVAGNGDVGSQYSGECIILNEAGAIGANCTGNWIAGNFLGTNESGTAALYFNPTANLQRGSGVQITNSTLNTIGTNADGVSDSFERNLISGNSDEGVVLVGSSSNKIKGNYIGTDKTGLVGLPNYINGGTSISTGQIVLKLSSNNNFIGTDGDGVNDNIEGNIIGSATITGVSASSYSDGIDIITTSTGNRISGNKIGIGSDGVTALNILTTGMVVNDYAVNINANNNTIGTNGDGISDAFEANYIGNSGSAIVLDNVSGCVVAGNYCGLATNLTASVTLGYAGVYIINSTSNRIGSTASNALEKNYICNSSQYGIWIDGSATANNDLNNIRYNTIGIRPDNSAAANAKNGIYIFSLSNADTIQYNTIARNGTAAATGTYPAIQIGGAGVNEQSSGCVINNNSIYKNIGPGISIVNNSSLTNKISQNSIYDNGNGSDATGKFKLGIDLAANGVTANDNLDPDTGPNALSNFPVITGASPGSSCQAIIAGTFNGLASTQYFIEVFSGTICNGDTSGVDYYSNASYNYGEGKTYVGSSSVITTDASGNANWTLGIPVTTYIGTYITAVAVQSNGTGINSTSEFSQCFQLTSDFGDAPDSYTTLSASCGPMHLNVNTNLQIGANVSSETDGLPSVNANGDTFDDGISAFPILHVKSTSYTLSSIPVNNATGSAATLYAWIDFNRNGAFESTEFTSVGVPSTGTQSVNLTWNLATFTCGTTLKEGVSYVRLRLTTTALTDNGATSSIDERCQGVASNGEVEDYKISILGTDYGDLPNTFPVATAVVYESTTSGKVWLGANGPGNECVQNFSIDALGDAISEEDGESTSSGPNGATYNWVILVNSNLVNKRVYFGMWIDWEGNSTFNGAGDAFYTGSALTNGSTNINVWVFFPMAGVSNPGVRVIASESPVTSGMYNSTVINSEVEDFYLLSVLSNSGIQLKATKNSNGNVLNWTNTSNLPIKNFTVQRSTDNNNWNTIGSMKTKSSDNSYTLYSYTDAISSTAPVYYRILITLYSGQEQYSNVVFVKNEMLSTDFHLYPNPVSRAMYISANNCYKKIELINQNGQVILSRPLVTSNDVVDLSHLAEGVYFVRLIAGDGAYSTKKIIKIK